MWKANLNWDGKKETIGIFASEESAAAKFDESLRKICEGKHSHADRPPANSLDQTHILLSIPAPALYLLDKKRWDVCSSWVWDDRTYLDL
jgi:hypothetical protein